MGSVQGFVPGYHLFPNARDPHAPTADGEHMLKRLIVAGLILITVTICAEAWAGHLHKTVEDSLRTLPPGAKLAVIVEMTKQASPAKTISTIPNTPRRFRARAVVEGLQNTAKENRAAIQALLSQYEDAGARLSA